MFVYFHVYVCVCAFAFAPLFLLLQLYCSAGKEEGAPRFAGIGLDTKSIVTEAGAFTLKVHITVLLLVALPML